jgi:hypothetical protein
VVDHLLASPGLTRGRARLRDVADPAANPGGVSAQVDARYRRLATGGREQGGEHAQRGGLPCAVGAEEADDLAFGDIEVDAAHCVDLGAAGAVGAGKAAGVDHRVSLGWLLRTKIMQFGGASNR